MGAAPMNTTAVNSTLLPDMAAHRDFFQLVSSAMASFRLKHQARYNKHTHEKQIPTITPILAHLTYLASGILFFLCAILLWVLFVIWAWLYYLQTKTALLAGQTFHYVFDQDQLESMPTPNDDGAARIETTHVETSQIEILHIENAHIETAPMADEVTFSDDDDYVMNDDDEEMKITESGSVSEPHSSPLSSSVSKTNCPSEATESNTDHTPLDQHTYDNDNSQTEWQPETRSYEEWFRSVTGLSDPNEPVSCTASSRPVSLRTNLGMELTEQTGKPDEPSPLQRTVMAPHLRRAMEADLVDVSVEAGAQSAVRIAAANPYCNADLDGLEF